MPAPPAFGRTSPSAEIRSSVFRLRRCAARSIMALRAVAAACRICMPPRWMPVEPEVRPWSGVSAVSPSIYLIFSMPMPSSSAAIWGIAMRSPWPRSTLPQYKVTVPSPFTARKASTSLASRRRGTVVAACAKALVWLPASVKPTITAPPLSSVRREKRMLSTGAFMLAPLSRCRHDRVHHPHMRAAAAEVHLERRADVVLAGFSVAGQQCCGAHDHAAGAVAALGHLVFDEGGLERMRLCRRAEPFEG